MISIVIHVVTILLHAVVNIDFIHGVRKKMMDIDFIHVVTKKRMMNIDFIYVWI